MKVTTRTPTKRFYEMITEDARQVAAEWREMGPDNARTMLAMTLEAVCSGEPLPEPAQIAQDRLRSYMRREDLYLAWSEMLNQLSIMLSR